MSATESKLNAVAIPPDYGKAATEHGVTLGSASSRCVWAGVVIIRTTATTNTATCHRARAVAGHPLATLAGVYALSTQAL